MHCSLTGSTGVILFIGYLEIREMWYPFCGNSFGLDNESSPARNLICCNVNTFASRADWISETITQGRWATGTSLDGTWIECLYSNDTRELTAIIYEAAHFCGITIDNFAEFKFRHCVWRYAKMISIFRQNKNCVL